MVVEKVSSRQRPYQHSKVYKQEKENITAALKGCRFLLTFQESVNCSGVSY
jgi:hypothetical protein